MTFTITINRDNADFEHDKDGATHRILSTVNWRKVIKDGRKTLMDNNGNTVGKIEVSTDDET